MAYSVSIERFEGPLDLLLQLVESQELEISQISLTQVTEPFLEHVRAHRGNIPLEELADFLVVAAKLVYLKSKILLPYLQDAELDEGPDLETQLRMYKAFADASVRLGKMEAEGRRAYARGRRMQIVAEMEFVPPTGVTGETLKDLFARIIKKLEPITRLPEVALRRAISIEDKISQLQERVSRLIKVSVHKFLSESQDRHEMVVAFLALLELVKQRLVTYEQSELFHDIHLTRTSAKV